MSLNTTVPNYSLTIATDQFQSIWKLTRVLKTAGWIYKSSADGTNTKDTTSSQIADQWGPGGIVSGNIQLGSQTGTGATVSAVSGNIVTMTVLTGMTTNSVGHSLTITGATNTTNNGTFTIISFVSSTSVKIFNPNLGVVESGTMTWSERVSGSATITWSNLANGREQTITGLTGMTTLSPGHQIYLQGSANSNNNGIFNILSYVSATSVIIINNNASAASNSATGQWTEIDPLLDVYPVQANLGSGAWINLQGPSTLRIPINAVAIGTFIKGENITQSVSNAQGELIGYQYDVPTAQGFIVVQPRVTGTGSGVKGWSTGVTLITGNASAATVTTASSTPIEYVREIVFWKGTSSQIIGSWYYQCLNASLESGFRFSTLSSATGCTTAICPGGGGTSNAFPTIGSFVLRGSGGSQAGTNWLTGSTQNLGRAHLIAINADFTTSSSADGTWTCALGYPVNGASSYLGIGFYRLDNNEDGDVDPYVCFAPNSGTIYSASRIAANATSSSAFDNFSNNNNNNLSMFFGFRRRGFSTNDGFQQFQSGTIGPTASATGSFIYAFTQDNDSLACSLSTIAPRVRDPIWIISSQNVQTVTGQIFGKMRKGTIRWGFIVSGGNGGDTYDTKKWIQLSNSNGPWVMGPWDGVTIPIQT